MKLKKMKAKRWLSAALIALLAVGSTVLPMSTSVAQAATIVPYWDEIEVVYRLINDELYYRRWNGTRAYWVDKRWYHWTEQLGS